MIYDFVPFHEVAKEIAGNFDTHYDDMTLKDEFGRANLDWDNYLGLSADGRCWAAIIKKDKLIGYAVFCISQNLNHKNILEAINTGIFIDKKYRGKLFKEFVTKADEYLKNLGVNNIIYAFNDHRAGLLLEKIGYKAKYIAWSKICYHS